jgi:membrane associated rhomboid family serine protease
MASLANRLRRLEWQSGGRLTPVLTLLLAVVTVIFLVCLISSRSSAPLADWLVCDRRLWEGQFWRPLTAALAHEAPLHALLNGLALFFLGGAIERGLGSRAFALLLLVAAVVPMALRTLWSADAALGSSGLVFAAITAFATLEPRAIIYFIVFPVQARFLAIGAMVLAVLLWYAPGDGVAHDAHLLGGLIGWLGVLTWRRVPQWQRRWQRARATQQAATEARMDAELDRLLAKVSAQGLPSLSAAERRFLARYSAQHRDRQP